MDKKSPIGVLDSGLGGISVLRALVDLMPHEDYIYFGDSANAPYGVRSDDEIMRLSVLATGHLIDQGVKAVVIGCNTITGVAAAELRRRWPYITIVATEPAVKPAALGAHGTMLVMATDATLRGGKFLALKSRYENDANIISCPCPGLMEFVERGEIHSPALRRYLEERFRILDGKKPDSVVLGCTHYPFVKEMIKSVLGDVKIFDGAEGIARQVKRCLDEAGLKNDGERPGSVTWQNSSDDPRVMEMAKMLFELR